MLIAEAWKCFHACVDCFRASVRRWGGGGGQVEVDAAFEVKEKRACSHRQRNMVRETIRYSGLWEM